jgi:internalin A
MTAAAAAAQTVTFTDPRLESAVRAAIGIPQPVPVTDTDMLRLTGLSAQNLGITSLDGLQWATNLTYLQAWNNQIADLTPLSGLRHLSNVDARYNQITDPSPLLGISSLRSLHLGFNSVANLAPFATMTSLTSLDLDSNGIADISPLANLSNLGVLSLASNHIADVGPLATLTSLRVLHLGRNQVSDISPLSGLTGLTSLAVNVNRISDISAVEGMTQLGTLDVSSNGRIADLTPIANHTGLVDLNVGGNLISDISVLSSLPNLTILTLNVNRVVDASPIAGLNKLQILYLGHNPNLSDISALSGLTQLSELYLSGDRISDLSPLSGLTRLRNLYLRRNQISDITPLASLTGLSSLDLDTNRIRDASPLLGLTSLWHLDLTENLQLSISPLVANPGLAAGDTIEVDWNYLDLTPGTPSMNDIGSLAARGANVVYQPQHVLPLTTILSTPADPDGVGGWFVHQPRAALSTNVQGAAITYSLDGAPDASYLGTITIAEGAHTLAAYSTDVRSMAGPTANVAFRVDTIAPTAPALSALDVTTSTASLSWTPSADSGSGVASYTLHAADGTVIDTAADTQFVVDGLVPDTSYGYYVTAIDVAGNVSPPSNTVTVQTATPDTTPPTTTISGGRFDEWTNVAPVHFDLTAADADSGVASTLYSLGGGSAQVYSGASVPVSAEGVTDISYWSVDNAGNTEAAKTATVKIDTIAPSMPVASVSAVGTSTANLSWTASTDSASGVASYAVYANGVMVAVTASTELALSELTPDTSYAYYVTSTDVAGNTSAPSDTVITRTEPLDTAAPVTTISGGPFDTWTRSVPVSFGLNATDEGGSGVSATYYAVNGGSPIAYTSDVSTTTDGMTTVSYWSVDNVGNTETAKTATIKIDTTAPSVPVLTLSAVATSTVSLLWTAAADYGSGVASYTLHAADGSVIAVTSATTYVLNGLAPGSTYGYYVTATDAVGNTSGPSNTQTVETPPDTTGNATRTWGFYKTHYNYDVVLFGRMGGTIDLGWSQANPLSDLKDVMGVLQSNPAHNSKKTKRNARSQAIIKTSYQLIAATLNTRLPHGAPVPTDPVTQVDLITAARNAMAGPYSTGSTAEILRLGELLEAYNSSGDAIDTGDPQSTIGNATPQLTDSQYSCTIPDMVTDY